MANKKISMSVYWPESLVEFVQNQLRQKTRLRQSDSSELAMEEYLKKEGLWDEYQATLTEEVL